MSTAAAALAAFDRGLRGTALVRALLAAQDWKTPCGDDLRPLLAPSPAGPWLNLFADTATLQSYRRALGAEESLFMEMSGLGAFDGLPQAYAGVNLNPDAQDAIHYRREQFPMLQSVVDAVKIESFLHGTDVPEPFALMRSYKHYYLLERDDHSLVLAPDSQGRRLLAICTTADTADALREQVQRELGVTAIARELDGVTLFERVRELPLDGLVFNPAGTVKPRAMGLALAEVVLTR